ncbi:hypothetical protein EDB89DRAFT_2045716 [Lactarius sanguifluus]|nr:hypothetical protein EDB89DRAFT_2045716 [Lactarius sanguifluus]
MSPTYTFTSAFLMFFFYFPIHLSKISLFLWGCRVDDLDSMRKFLQFLTPAHIMAIAIIIYSVVAPPGNEPILIAVQLLWIHFQVIVGTLVVLVLTTDPESSVLLNQKPDKKTDPLFTINMTKQILGQLYYQSAIILIFHVFGSQILGFHHIDDSSLQEHHSDIVRTFVFNVFIFNSFNCRHLDQKWNVFEGMWRNWYFMAIITIGVSPHLCLYRGLKCSIRGCHTSPDMFHWWFSFRRHPHAR